MPAQSHLRCTAMTVTLPTGEALLRVIFELDCPLCGQGTIVLAGHHLRAMRDAIIQTIDLHPTLTGADDDVKTIEKIQFGIGGPSRPEDN